MPVATPSFVDSKARGIQKRQQDFAFSDPMQQGLYAAAGGVVSTPTFIPDPSGSLPSVEGQNRLIGAQDASQKVGTPNLSIYNTYAAQQAKLNQNLANLNDLNSTLDDNSTTSTPTGNVSTSHGGKRVVENAKRYLGIAYKWGGTGNGGYDCSGFTQRAAKDSGVNLPRTAQQQYDWFKQRGRLVSYANAKPGDLIYFRSSASPSGRHTGIYIGNGKMIDAPGKGRTIGVHRVWNVSGILGVGRLP